MYQDDPDWQVLFNLLRGIYHNNPVRIDIAGTIDSIAQINAELLYSCYNTFYNLSNMALSVAGNVTKDEVIAIADKMLKKEEKKEFQQIIPDEPKQVAQSYVEQTLGVDIEKFALGFKENYSEPIRTAKQALLMNIALEVIGGKVSSLYSRLMKDGLINTSFGKEYFTGRGFSLPIFTGESHSPEKVKDEILKEIDTIKENGISQEDFDVAIKKLYGAEVYRYNDVDDLAGNMLDCYFNSSYLFEKIDLYKTVSKKEVEDAVKNSFDKNNCCLSVIK